MLASGGRQPPDPYESSAHQGADAPRSPAQLSMPVYLAKRAATDSSVLRRRTADESIRDERFDWQHYRLDRLSGRTYTPAQFW